MTYTNEALFLVSLLSLLRDNSHGLARYRSNIRDCKTISEAPRDAHSEGARLIGGVFHDTTIAMLLACVFSLLAGLMSQGVKNER